MRTINIVLGLTLIGLAILPLQNAYSRGVGQDTREVRSDRRDVAQDTSNVREERKDVTSDTEAVRDDRSAVREDVKTGDTADIAKDKSDLEQDVSNRQGDVQDRSLFASLTSSRLHNYF